MPLTVNSMPSKPRTEDASFPSNVFAVPPNTNKRRVLRPGVWRVSRRLVRTEHQDPKKIVCDLLETVREEQRTLFLYLLIFHERRVCEYRKSGCPGCVLNDVCPSAFED